MHGAAQAFRRAVAIGTAKNISFKEKTSGKLKNSFTKKNIKNKKKISMGARTNPC